MCVSLDERLQLLRTFRAASELRVGLLSVPSLANLKTRPVDNLLDEIESVILKNASQIE
jgi:hypothetical protein